MLASRHTLPSHPHTPPPTKSPPYRPCHLTLSPSLCIGIASPVQSSLCTTPSPPPVVQQSANCAHSFLISQSPWLHPPQQCHPAPVSLRPPCIVTHLHILMFPRQYAPIAYLPSSMSRVCGAPGFLPLDHLLLAHLISCLCRLIFVSSIIQHIFPPRPIWTTYGPLQCACRTVLRLHTAPAHSRAPLMLAPCVCVCTASYCATTHTRVTPRPAPEAPPKCPLHNSLLQTDATHGRAHLWCTAQQKRCFRNHCSHAHLNDAKMESQALLGLSPSTVCRPLQTQNT